METAKSFSRLLNRIRRANVIWLSLVALVASGAAQAATITVTNLNDSGTGSLRAAIGQANILTGSDTIIFSVSGTIQPLSQLPALSDATGGTTISGGGVIAIDGTSLGSSDSGLVIASSGNDVSGLTIMNCPGSGISVTGAGATMNTVATCRLGTDGVNAKGNLYGVEIRNGANNNRIGGLTAATRNIISGNSRAGVLIADLVTSSNGVEGNYIGLDTSGSNALSNGTAGIEISGGASSNIVGGTPVGAGNVISGNATYGVLIQNSFSSGNTIQANYIGTNAAGTSAIGNGSDGVAILLAASGNTVGGTAAGTGNIISGNSGSGVTLDGIATTGNLVQRNSIGLNAAGTVALGNGGDGVATTGGASTNTIGGSTAGAGNTIAGNAGAGVLIQDTGTLSNVVAGNVIGTNPSGTSSFGNAKGIMILSGASMSKIGGASATERNLISGNTYDGVLVSGPGTTGVTVEGNYIGTDVGGTLSVPNGEYGVILTGGASGCSIGGTIAGSGNLISGNGAQGVQIDGAGSSSNVVQGNFIGVTITAKVSLPNEGDGVKICAGATSNTVGGTVAGSANVISGNHSNGVLISDTGVTGNLVEGNLIGVDDTGTTALGNTHAGVNISGGANSNTVGAIGASNIISGNATGVFLYDVGTTGNVVVANHIGADADGVFALGNATGVFIGNQASGNTIGGVAAGTGNLISGNAGPGVHITDAGTSSNAVKGNAIGTDWTLGAALGNNGPGVKVSGGATLDTVGGVGAGDGNTIAFNAGEGVKVSDAATRLISIRGNSIHDNSVGIVLDAGANDGITKPSLLGLVPANGNAPASSTIEIFVDAGEQGETRVSAVTASTDGHFSDAALNLLPYVGKYLTVTATDASGNTTEFCAAVKIDLAAPTVNAIALADPDPTNASTVDFTVTFSEPVTGVDETDFALTTTLSGAAITNVTDNGGGVFTVTTTTGTGDGGLRLDLVDDDTIADLSLNPLGGVGAGNGSFTGSTYTLDRTEPSPLMTSSAPEPTGSTPIPVTVTFTEAVADFSATTVVATNASVSNFGGSGASYTFDLIPTGQGTVSAEIPSGVIHDIAGNVNGPGATLSRTYDSVSPTVSIVSPTLDPVNTVPIPVVVTFSEPVTGFASNDLVVSNATVSNFGGSGANYSFDLTPVTPGLVNLDIASGAATDAAGNPSVAATTLTRTYDAATATGALTGVIQDFVTGARLSCAAVRVYSSAIPEERIVTVDLNGVYHAINLPVGEYTVESFAPGYQASVVSTTISQGAQRVVNLGLHGGADTGGIRGVVTDATTTLPLLGVRVDARIGGLVVATTYTCAEGAYELANLVAKADAIVTVEYSDPNYQTASRDTQVSSGATSTVDTALQLKSLAPGSLAGVITNATNGHPLQGARVAISGGASPAATTDQYGAYQFPALPEGTYTVDASATDFVGQLQVAGVTAFGVTVVDFALAPGVIIPNLNDIDGNGAVDAVDVQLVINKALGLVIIGDADVNRSGAVDAVDVQLVINAALEKHSAHPLSTRH